MLVQNLSPLQILVQFGCNFQYPHYLKQKWALFQQGHEDAYKNENLKSKVAMIQFLKGGR